MAILQNTMLMAMTAIGVAALGYLGLCVLVVLVQSRVVYYPARGIETTPGAAGMDFEPVTFAADDGVRLTGWYIPAGDRRAVVMVCHGNGGNISHLVHLAGLMHRVGLGVFLFDYRGYGDSEGRPGEKGTYLDAEAAWRHLTDELGVAADRIVLHGRSLGAAVAARLARSRRPAALVLESGFTSIGDIGAQLYPWLPMRLLTRHRYNALKYVTQVACPVLVIHSPEDRMIPFDHGVRLFSAANEPKQFLRISGSHNSGYEESGSVYIDGLNEFITAHVG